MLDNHSRHLELNRMVFLTRGSSITIEYKFVHWEICNSVKLSNGSHYCITSAYTSKGVCSCVTEDISHCFGEMAKCFYMYM